MRSILIFATIVCLANCLTNDLITKRTPLPENQDNLGIYGGKNTTIRQHPNLAVLLVDGQYFCTAVIVNESWVCTIGDCVNGFSPSDLTIVTESNDGSTGQKYSASKVLVHPKYQSAPLDYNYACIKTSSKLKLSAKCKPAKLPSKAAGDNSVMVVAGWGDTSAVPESAANGRIVGGIMKWQSTDFCKKAYASFGFNWTDRMACVYNKGKTTPCHGDWGTPSIGKDGVVNGLFMAIASQGICSSKAYPAILSNIFTVVSWIKQIIGASYDYE